MTSDPRLFMPPSLAVRYNGNGAHSLMLKSSRGSNHDEVIRDGMTEVYALNLLEKFSKLSIACRFYSLEELWACVATEHGEVKATAWLGEKW